MSYKLMQNIKEELDRIAEKGLNTSNLETAYKLIDMKRHGKCGILEMQRRIL